MMITTQINLEEAPELNPAGFICPQCGSQDLQLDGLQAVRVVEDWTDGERWNYHYSADPPPGQWLTLEAHCNVCDHEWGILDPGEFSARAGEDLPLTGEHLPPTGEEKPLTEGVDR